jgi:hypothetical protein
MKASKKTKGRARAPKRTAAASARRKRSAKSGARSDRKRAARAAVRPAGATAASREVELEAAVLRRLLKHFDERKDVQNIELMILAGFCRNCLSKWLVEAAEERGVDFDIERAREKVYGMPYDEWKQRHQQPATEEQLARFADAERRSAERRAAQKG